MGTGTRSLEAKSLNSPDETRPFAAKGKAEVVKLGRRDGRPRSL